MQMCGDILSKDRKSLQCISVATGMTGWEGNNIFNLSHQIGDICAHSMPVNVGLELEVMFKSIGTIQEIKPCTSCYLLGNIHVSFLGTLRERERAHKGSKPLQVIWQLWAK